MKIKILLSAIIASSAITTASCQTVIDMASSNNNLPSNFLSTGEYYFKDLQNNLDKFTGTWLYVNGNEKFELILLRINNHHVLDSELDYNYFEDGISIQYKKYVNDVVVYTSPVHSEPLLTCRDGISLEGFMTDYGRITKTDSFTIPGQQPFVFRQGGEPASARCWMKRVSSNPDQVLFKLSLLFPKNHDAETYAGQPIFSIPNNVVLTRQ